MRLAAVALLSVAHLPPVPLAAPRRPLVLLVAVLLSVRVLQLLAPSVAGRLGEASAVPQRPRPVPLAVAAVPLVRPRVLPSEGLPLQVPLAAVAVAVGLLSEVLLPLEAPLVAVVVVARLVVAVAGVLSVGVQPSPLSLLSEGVRIA